MLVLISYTDLLPWEGDMFRLIPLNVSLFVGSCRVVVSFRSIQMRADVHLKSGDPPGFREGMLSLFHPHVPMEVVSDIAAGN